VPIGGVGDATVDVRPRREGWVHEYDARPQLRLEVVVDVGRVEAGHGSGREEGGEQVGAGFTQFVEHERCLDQLGEDSEQPGAGRGLEHHIIRGDGGRRRGHET